MNCRHARALGLSAVVLVMSSHVVTGQTRRPLRLPGFSEGPACSGEIANPAGTLRTARLSYVSYLRNAEECGFPRSDRSPLNEEEPSPARLLTLPADPLEKEFLGMGAAGFVIAAARQQVILILAENSSCSSWYAQEEPKSASKFASLHFRVDAQGEDTAIGDYNYFGLYYREPYVARAQQNVGAGSIITLNEYGAFFLWRAPAKARWSGGPLVPQPPKLLRIGNYLGGTVNSQVTTMLHEFAHIIGLLPIDSGEANSALMSTQNTETVLRYCRKQIEASANRTIVLPLSLAQLDRLARDR